jgi:phosphate-selective porin
MIKIIIASLALAFSATVFAADAENSGSTTVDHSKNPLTGTETTTKKTEKTVKGEHGKGKMKMKETTKKKTDGSTETETKIDGDSSEKH